MGLRLRRILDTVARSLLIPEEESEGHLGRELAAALYASDLLSFGNASELAGLSRFDFLHVLAKRGIARHRSVPRSDWIALRR